jgi:nicotinamidase-related amidase
MVEAHHENIRATTAGTPPVAVPVSGMALLLIDVINDLAFDGSEALVAHAESTAAPLARLKHRATAVGVPTIHINDTSGSGALIFAAPSSIAPHALLQVTRVEASPPTARDYFVLKPKHSGFFGEIPPHAGRNPTCHPRAPGHTWPACRDGRQT